jgi:hypothetical protein
VADVVQTALEATVSSALRGVMKRYFDDRRDMLIEELRIAQVDLQAASERDEFVAMLIRFFQAAMQGAAFRNLRVIAQVLAYKTKQEDPSQDDFLMWADAIGGLAPDEVVFVATLLRETVAAEEREVGADAACIAAHNATRAILFDDNPSAMLMVGSSTQRTGLVVSLSVFGGNRYQVTSKMRRLADMARLNEWAEDAMSACR